MITDQEIDKCIAHCIMSEGGDKYTNDPDDKGGPTKYGITLRTLKAHKPRATAQTVKDLTLNEAVTVYKKDYAAQFLFVDDIRIFNFLFNSAVQHGVERTILFCQRACGFQNKDIDGVMGVKTIAAIMDMDKFDFMIRLISHRCKFYGSITAHNSPNVKFSSGWFNRISKDLGVF